MVEEALPFPTGLATSELITAMHAPSRPEVRTGRRGWLLAGVAGLSVAITALRDAFKVMPGMTALPGSLGGVQVATLGWGVGWSPMLLAIGMMTGLHLGAEHAGRGGGGVGLLGARGWRARAC
ncbi:OPT/YSL family transporter [Pyxidicoccus sp. 3LG]